MNEKKSLLITRAALGISLITNLVVWQTNRIQQKTSEVLQQLIQDQQALNLSEIQDSSIRMISMSCPEGVGIVAIDCDEGGTWVLPDSASDVVIDLNVDEKPILKDFSLDNVFDDVGQPR